MTKVNNCTGSDNPNMNNQETKHGIKHKILQHMATTQIGITCPQLTWGH